jgi:hypothetical protein
MPISPCRTVERLTLRTGESRTRPTLETELKNIRLPDVPGGGERGKEAVYRLYQVEISSTEFPQDQIACDSKPASFHQ